MEKIKELSKKINIENILCAFIIICPILDIMSFLFRNKFNTNYSPSTFVRPIISITVMMYLFIKRDKKFKLYSILTALFYMIYAIIHLYLFEKVKTGSSYSTAIHEAQYLINYSFMILNLFIYIDTFKNKDASKLKLSVLGASCIYIISIYISIITKTSSHTYVLEGIGYKGWFESGNSIGAILILSMFIYIGYIKDKKYRKVAIPILILNIIFLTTLIGTRVGLLGVVCVLSLYAIVEVFEGLLKNKKLDKKVIICISVAVVSIGILVTIFGSATFERRKHLKNIENDIIDESLEGKSHITGDLLEIKNKIDDGTLEAGYMSESQKQSILDLYNTANKLNVTNNDQRMQQLIYNIALVKNQKNIGLIIFGNGYMANFRELVLEMEIPAFLFNFGILGFTLYFVPFLAIFIYGAYIAIKNMRKVDDEYLMLLLGCGFTFALSFFSGYTFFNSSSMMIIVIMNALLVNKIYDLKIEP